MKKCKSCQKEIDAKAKKCPHCQTDQRNWFLRHPILTGLLILLVIGLIGSMVGAGTQNTTTQSDNQTEKTVAAEPEVVDVTVFADDFDNNQVAAEKKWKDKLIQFSATISNITDSGLSFYNVASKEFSGTQISCRVTNKEQLLPLKNGQTVTVRGIVGSQTIGVISVENCEVVQ